MVQARQSLILKNVQVIGWPSGVHEAGEQIVFDHVDGAAPGVVGVELNPLR